MKVIRISHVEKINLNEEQATIRRPNNQIPIATTHHR